MLEDPFQDEDQAADRRRTILPLFLWALVVGAVIGGIFYVSKLHADPLFSTTVEGATITLTNEPCQLGAVSNLPLRATWVEKDETFEGCWGGRPDIGMVITYFDDKTVALIPIQVFRKVVGA